jgi:CheY-specific phosphatase CheX
MENMEKIRKTLTVSIFEVFEKMFYIFLEPVDKCNGEYKFAVSIKFSGPANGVIGVKFSRELAEVMVQNMLNIDRSEITDRLVEDCLKESVNMIGGNFLRKLDSSKVFNLSLPEMLMFFQNTGELLALPSEDILELGFTSSEGIMETVITFSSGS